MKMVLPMKVGGREGGREGGRKGGRKRGGREGGRERGGRESKEKERRQHLPYLYGMRCLPNQR